MNATITEEQANNFVEEYKALCEKHKILIRQTVNEELTLDRENDAYYFKEHLNELLSEFSDRRYKTIKKEKDAR